MTEATTDARADATADATPPAIRSRSTPAIVGTAIGRTVLGLKCLLLAWLLSGCTTINTVSAVRLSGEGQLTARAMIDSLDGTRRALATYVEGQALQSRLSGREALPPQALCSIRAVQRGLRLRVLMLRKLVLLYDRFTALAQFEYGDEAAPIYDELMLDIDRYEHLPEPSPGAGCPEDDAQTSLPTTVRSEAPPPRLTRISQDRSLILASTRIRSSLERIHKLWEHEKSVYLSVQKTALQGQRTLAKLLLTRYASVSPSLLFAPHLSALGLDWDAYAFVSGRDKLTAEQLQALNEGLAAALDERSRRLLAEEEARYTQQSELLLLLSRQHVILEQGQAIDLRHISQYLVPLLRSVNITTCTPTPTATPAL